MRWFITAFRLVLMVVTNIFFSCVALLSIVFQRNGSGLFWAGSTWSRFVLWISNVKVTTTGLEEIDRNGNFIIVSNHASFYDVPTLMTVFPKMRIMFKKELSYIPFWGWALKYGQHIMVDRKRGAEAIKSLDRAAKAIGKGGQILLFAEGTRTRNGKLLPFKRGAFSLAVKSGVPILPVAINGSFQILPKGSFDIRPAKINAVFGSLIPTTGKSTREDEMKLMNEVYEVISKNYRENIS